VGTTNQLITEREQTPMMTLEAERFDTAGKRKMSEQFEYLTVSQAKHALGLSARGTEWLIEVGRLKATKVGKTWIIGRTELERVVAERETLRR
jgi:excisionase family DNA binding protein